jgi:hypothetical protein
MNLIIQYPTGLHIRHRIDYVSALPQFGLNVSPVITYEYNFSIIMNNWTVLK